MCFRTRERWIRVGIHIYRHVSFGKDQLTPKFGGKFGGQFNAWTKYKNIYTKASEG